MKKQASRMEEVDSDIEALQGKSDQPKEIVYNQEQMKETIKNFKKYFREKILKKTSNRKQLLFQDYMDITSEKEIDLLNINLNDDIQREVQFYNIALENADKALAKLEQEKIEIQRPDDYLCEMFKSDKIMTKVRSKLVNQQVKINNYEEKKQKLINKKFGKQLKSQQEEDRGAYKKKNLQAIEQWKHDLKTKGSARAGDLSQVLMPLEAKKKRQGMQERIKRIQSDQQKFRSSNVRLTNSKKIQKQKKKKRPGKIARNNSKKKFNSRKRK